MKRLKKIIFATMFMLALAGAGKVLPYSVPTNTICVHAEEEAAETDITSEAKKLLLPLLKDFLSIIGLIAAGIGILMAGYGIIQLLLSLSDNNGASKKEAFQFLIVGVVLIFAEVLILSMDLTKYFGGEESSGTNSSGTEAQLKE